MSRIEVTVTAFLLLGAWGCVGSLPVTHYYTLGPPADFEPAPSAEIAANADEPGADGGNTGLIVGVEPFAVDPPYDQDRLVFRRGADSNEVGFYAYHRWAAPLDRMIVLAVVEGLRGIAGIRSIEPAASTGDYTARLGGRVLYIEEVVRPSGAEVRVGISFELRDSGGNLLWASSSAARATGDAAMEGGEIAQLIRSCLEEVILGTRERLGTALSD